MCFLCAEKNNKVSFSAKSSSLESPVMKCDIYIYILFISGQNGQNSAETRFFKGYLIAKLQMWTYPLLGCFSWRSMPIVFSSFYFLSFFTDFSSSVRSSKCEFGTAGSLYKRSYCSCCRCTAVTVCGTLLYLYVLLYSSSCVRCCKPPVPSDFSCIALFFVSMIVSICS